MAQPYINWPEKEIVLCSNYGVNDIPRKVSFLIDKFLPEICKDRGVIIVLPILEIDINILYEG